MASHPPPNHHAGSSYSQHGRRQKGQQPPCPRAPKKKKKKSPQAPEPTARIRGSARPLNVFMHFVAPKAIGVVLTLLGRPRAACLFFLAATAACVTPSTASPTHKFPEPPSADLPSTCTRIPGFGPPVVLTTWPPHHPWPAAYTAPLDTGYNGAGGGTTQLPNAMSDPLLAYYYARYYAGESPETDIHHTAAPETKHSAPAVIINNTTADSLAPKLDLDPGQHMSTMSNAEKFWTGNEK